MSTLINLLLIATFAGQLAAQEAGLNVEFLEFLATWTDEEQIWLDSVMDESAEGASPDADDQQAAEESAEPSEAEPPPFGSGAGRFQHQIKEHAYVI